MLLSQLANRDALLWKTARRKASFGRYGAEFKIMLWGNIVCAGYPTCQRSVSLVSSWLTGYEDFYQLISREYVARGLTTVEAITPVYAPSSENDTGFYIQQVRSGDACLFVSSISYEIGETFVHLSLCLVVMFSVLFSA